MENEVYKGVLEEEKPKPTKKNDLKKYVIYLVFVLLATGISLFFSLYGQVNEVANAFANAKWQILLLIAGVMALSIFADGLILTIFSRLYTRKYYIHQGVAVSLIGTFYSEITPGASGGQFMQAMTMKKQGIPVSNAASIVVMWFILYQLTLVIFGVIALIFKWNLLLTSSIDIALGDFQLNLPMIPLIIVGFLLNILIIGLLFLMSYSRAVHNFIMHYGINIFAKLHIIKDPDKTRESLRIQVENFKIELRRLQSNVAVTIVIILLMLVLIICRFSIPWFAGIAIDAYSSEGVPIADLNPNITGSVSVASFFDACFLSSFHQMVTGLIPMPGSAGVSELAFSILFGSFYNTSASVVACNIIWRTSTFHVLFLISGFVCAFYKASPKEQTAQANRKTFLDLQLATYEERKRTSDTLFETTQLSKKELSKKLNNLGVFGKKAEQDEIQISTEVSKENKDVYVEPKKKKKKKKNKNSSGDWDNIEIGSGDE